MRLRDIRPSDEELRVILESGYVLRDIRQFDEAEDIFRGVIELVPQSDVPRVGLGTVKLQQGLFTEAEAVYDEVLRIKPDSIYARVHRAEALLFQKRRDEAEAELREIISIDPTSSHSRTAQALLDAADMICGKR
jgi:tetratricopeptide (TPR) repeat protein